MELLAAAPWIANWPPLSESGAIPAVSSSRTQCASPARAASTSNLAGLVPSDAEFVGCRRGPPPAAPFSNAVSGGAPATLPVSSPAGPHAEAAHSSEVVNHTQWMACRDACGGGGDNGGPHGEPVRPRGGFLGEERRRADRPSLVGCAGLSHRSQRPSRRCFARPASSSQNGPRAMRWARTSPPVATRRMIPKSGR